MYMSLCPIYILCTYHCVPCSGVLLVFVTTVCRVYPDGKRIPVNRNNLLLRGCVLRNTEAAIGIVVYAGVCVCVCVCVRTCERERD